jgi:quercetin 2,3-dioxygenase
MERISDRNLCRNRPIAAQDCVRAESADIQRIKAHETLVGKDLTIRRALPTAQQRMVGAWCFLDHFGPFAMRDKSGIQVGPHPHIGLQAVTWLVEGEFLHRDSLGVVQRIRPGELNVMTAGRGIAHSEELLIGRPDMVHGTQLWIALPASERHRKASFDHYPELPRINLDGWTVTVLVGTALGEHSPANIHSPLVGLQIAAATGATTRLPLHKQFEYGAIALSGTAQIDNEPLDPGTFMYFGAGRSSITLTTFAPARLLLLGGEPFEEEIMMWWNFVGRSQDELTRACQEWNAGQGPFGTVLGYRGTRLAAPLPPWSA